LKLSQIPQKCQKKPDFVWFFFCFWKKAKHVQKQIFTSGFKKPNWHPCYSVCTTLNCTSATSYSCDATTTLFLIAQQWTTSDATTINIYCSANCTQPPVQLTGLLAVWMRHGDPKCHDASTYWSKKSFPSKTRNLHGTLEIHRTPPHVLWNPAPDLGAERPPTMLFSHMCDMRVPLTNFYQGKFFVDPIGSISLEYYLILLRNTYHPIDSHISRSFFHGIWPVFCLRLIRATYPEGQTFRMSHHRISVIQSNRKCHLAMGECRALSFLCKNST